jgi:hypothetical protein
MIKYMVRLNEEEHAQLSTLITTGRAVAAKLLHARILLKADVRAGGRRWTDWEATFRAWSPGFRAAPQQVAA